MPIFRFCASVRVLACISLCVCVCACDHHPLRVCYYYTWAASPVYTVFFFGCRCLCRCLCRMRLSVNTFFFFLFYVAEQACLKVDLSYMFSFFFFNAILLQQKQTNKQTKETLPSKSVVLTVSETEKKKKKPKNCFSEVVHVFPYFFFFLSLHRLSCVAIECTCALSQLFQSNNTPAVERNASRCVYGWRRGHTRKKKKMKKSYVASVDRVPQLR